MVSVGGAAGILAQLSEELAAAVERGGRSVYTIHGRRRLPGSGIAWPGGYIVTADHVIEPRFFLFRGRRAGPDRGGPNQFFERRVPASLASRQAESAGEGAMEPAPAEEVTVTRPEGTMESATLVGRDPATDLAVLKLAGDDERGPAVVELAPIGSVRAGNLMLAIGRPTGNGVGSSLGVVTAVGDKWWTGRGGVIEGYIQADVTMYPGFSGGPLVDVQGRVVGLNSSQLGRGEHVAIPSHTVETIVRKLVAGQQVRRAYLGISSQLAHVAPSVREKASVDQEVGLLVIWVEPGSPAEHAGLIVGDILLTLGGHSIVGARDLLEALAPEVVGKSCQAVILRGGERQEIVVTPGERS